MQFEDKVLKRYELFVGIAIFAMAAAVALQKMFFEDASLALINLFFSLLPTIYILFSKTEKKFNSEILIGIIIILVRLITSIFSFDKLDTYDIVVQLCYDVSLIFNIMSIYLVFDRIKVSKTFDFKYVNYGLIISTIIYCVYNLIGNFKYFAYFDDIAKRRLISFSGFFANRNLFGIMLFLALIATYYEINKRKTKFLVITKYVFIFNLILTLSRNAILSFVIFFLIENSIQKKYKVLVAMVVLLVSLLLTNAFGLRDILFTYVIRSDEMTSGRTIIWGTCLEVFLDSPLIGYGELYISRLIDGLTGVTSMHSWFFKLLLTGGIINLFAYACIVLDCFRKSLHIMKIKHKHANIALPVMIGFFSYGLFEEINLFEFGLINMCVTFYMIIMPKVLYNQEREKIDE